MTIPWIAGPAPTSIDDFTQLEFLDLSETQISGPIPTSIDNYTQLQELDLFNTVWPKSSKLLTNSVDGTTTTEV